MLTFLHRDGYCVCWYACCVCALSYPTAVLPPKAPIEYNHWTIPILILVLSPLFFMNYCYWCWCICEPLYRGPSRGPCIGSIYPTLLGFGGIQAIILSYPLSNNWCYFHTQGLSAVWLYYDCLILLTVGLRLLKDVRFYRPCIAYQNLLRGYGSFVQLAILYCVFCNGQSYLITLCTCGATSPVHIK